MQILHAQKNDEWVTLTIPSPDTSIDEAHAIHWGDAGTIFTPAFWRLRYWIDVEIAEVKACTYKLGDSLLEETVACLLGGYGITAETSMAYFRRFKELHAFELDDISQADVWQILQSPILISGKKRRYRFWKSKGIYIYRVLTEYRNLIHDLENFTGESKAFRKQLTQISGIGIKTASWIARNWLECNDIAVVDIHIHRALQLMGVDTPPPKSDAAYLQSESHFLNLCSSLETTVNMLDILVWDHMRRLNTLALNCLRQKGLAPPHAA